MNNDWEKEFFLTGYEPMKLEMGFIGKSIFSAIDKQSKNFNRTECVSFLLNNIFKD